MINNNKPITEVNLTNIQASNILADDCSTNITINQSSTSDSKDYKSIDQYKLSHREPLNILQTTVLRNNPENLLNICLQAKIKGLEEDIERHYNSLYTSHRARFIGNKIRRQNPISLKKLINLSEENKNVLYNFIRILNVNVMRSINAYFNISTIWIVHNLIKENLIYDGVFIDNLIISLINYNLDKLSDPEQDQSEITHINLINMFLKSKTNIYYMSGEYVSDKSILIKKMEIRDISYYAHQDKMLKYRFHFEITKQEDSKVIQALNSIKKELQLSVFKEAVNDWINYNIKKSIELLETVTLNKLTIATKENDTTTIANADNQAREIKAKLEKLRNLSAIDKNKLCDFIAYFYQSLVIHKDKITLNNKDHFASKVLWDIDYTITGDYIDNLVVSLIKYFINLLSDPQDADKTCIAEIDTFIESKYSLYQICIRQLDDKQGLETVSADNNILEIVSASPQEKDGGTFIGIRFYITTST